MVEASDDADHSVTLGLPLWPGFSRSDATTGLHAGVTAAVIDTAGHDAVALSPGRGVPTIELRVDDLRMGRGERVAAKACALRPGGPSARWTVAAHDAAGALIVVGRGKYSTV